LSFVKTRIWENHSDSDSYLIQGMCRLHPCFETLITVYPRDLPIHCSRIYDVIRVVNHRLAKRVEPRDRDRGISQFGAAHIRPIDLLRTTTIIPCPTPSRRAHCPTRQCTRTNASLSYLTGKYISFGGFLQLYCTLKRYRGRDGTITTQDSNDCAACPFF
jgi:hypothetical protein